MKNKKWLTYTIGILLALIALAAAGGIGFRIGITQSESFVKAMKDMPNPHFGPNFDGGPSLFMHGNPRRGEYGFQGMQGMRRDHGFGNWHGGMSFFSPIFGFIHLLILGLLLWAVYKLIQNSGWRIVRVETSTTSNPAVLESEAPKPTNKKKKGTE